MNKLFYMVDMQLQFLEKNKHLIDINEIHFRKCKVCDDEATGIH